MATNDEGPGELSAGLNSIVISSNSSASYHTPGSPPKQQSESGSSLSRLSSFGIETQLLVDSIYS
jgi:hypothetical protein